MNTRTVILLFAFAMVGLPSWLRAESKPTPRLIEELIDTPVVAEGILCDLLAKGVGPRLVGVNSNIQLQFKQTPKFGLDGRLVQVHGTTRKRQMEIAAPGAGGFGESFAYYVIEVSKYQVIERVALRDIEGASQVKIQAP